MSLRKEPAAESSAASSSNLAGPKSDLQALADGHRFLRSAEDDLSKDWESKVSRKYYDSLHKDFVIADLRQVDPIGSDDESDSSDSADDDNRALGEKKKKKSNEKSKKQPSSDVTAVKKKTRVGFRWRTRAEVLAEKGVSHCGAIGCEVRRGLKTFEVPFVYREATTAVVAEKSNTNEREVSPRVASAGMKTKAALVKARLCVQCAFKLQFAREAEKRCRAPTDSKQKEAVKTQGIKYKSTHKKEKTTDQRKKEPSSHRKTEKGRSRAERVSSSRARKKRKREKKKLSSDGEMSSDEDTGSDNSRTSSRESSRGARRGKERGKERKHKRRKKDRDPSRSSGTSAR